MFGTDTGLGDVIRGNKLREDSFFPLFPQDLQGFSDFTACKEVDVDLGQRDFKDSSNQPGI